jgi:hypothetical protein
MEGDAAKLQISRHYGLKDTGARVAGAVCIHANRLINHSYHCAPPLHPRINAISRIVATIDTSKEPTQPSRLEKNANTAQQPLH